MMEKTIYLSRSKLFLRISSDRKYTGEIINLFLIGLSPVSSYCKNKDQAVDIILNTSISEMALDTFGAVKGKHFQSRFIDNRREGFIIKTSGGSWVKTDLRKKEAHAEFVKGDRLAVLMLKKWLRLFVLLRSTVRLHGVYLQNSAMGLLLTGVSGAGKSTMAGVLSETYGFDILLDDECRVFNAHGTVYISGHGVKKRKDLFLSPPSGIVFIERRDSRSESVLITEEEAFKRLCFASEFPDFEEEELKWKRLRILNALARQCVNLRLINGNGLKDNPELLKQLILGRLKSAKHAKK